MKMNDGEPEQTKVHVSFDYYPDEPDPSSPVGMSEDEYNSFFQRVMELGGDEIMISKVE
jgi:hypothetical protein